MPGLPGISSGCCCLTAWNHFTLGWFLCCPGLGTNWDRCGGTMEMLLRVWDPTEGPVPHPGWTKFIASSSLCDISLRLKLESSAFWLGRRARLVKYKVVCMCNTIIYIDILAVFWCSLRFEAKSSLSSPFLSFPANTRAHTFPHWMVAERLSPGVLSQNCLIWMKYTWRSGDFVPMQLLPFSCSVEQNSAAPAACTPFPSQISLVLSKMLLDPPELKVLFKCKLLFTISYAWYKFAGSFIFTLVCSSKSFHSYNLYAKVFPVLSHIFQYVLMKSE